MASIDLIVLHAEFVISDVIGGGVRHIVRRIFATRKKGWRSRAYDLRPFLFSHLISSTFVFHCFVIEFEK